MSIHVGIGSWSDDAYVGVLYPPGLPKSERLEHYAQTFRHLEVNSSYYAVPTPAVVRRWLKQTPANFTFSVKLHRAFSQSPAKAADGPLLDRLLEATKPLIAARRLATLFLVMPPRFGPDRHRLEEFDPLIKKLGRLPLAVELRDRAWVNGNQREATLRYFRDHRLIWIAVDMPRIPGSQIMPPIDEVTHPGIAYMRLHGRNPHYLAAKTAAEGHHYAYNARELTSLARRARALAQRAKRVYVIANNHADDFAPRAAIALQAKLGA